VGYIYDTQIIYRIKREEEMNDFSWDSETYYRTPSGKPKKCNREGKKVSVAENEFQKAQEHFNFTFDTKLNL